MRNKNSKKNIWWVIEIGEEKKNGDGWRHWRRCGRVEIKERKVMSVLFMLQFKWKDNYGILILVIIQASFFPRQPTVESCTVALLPINECDKGEGEDPVNECCWILYSCFTPY